MSVSRYIVFAVLLLSFVPIALGVATAQQSANEVSVNEINQVDRGNEYTVVQTWERKLNSSASSPVVIGDHVYVSSANHIKKIDRRTGETEWVSQAGEYEPRITASEGELFVADGNLHRIDTSSGESVWSFRRSDIVTTPTADEDSVYVGSMSGTIYSVDRETGDLVWRKVGLINRFVPPPVDASVVSKVEEGQDRLYAGGSNTIYGLEKGTGDVVWKGPTYRGMRSSPEYSNGRVYLNHGTHLQAIDTKTGVPMWNTDTVGGPDGVGHPRVSNGTVYFTDFNGTVYSVNKTTGRMNWNLNIGSTVINAPPSVGKDAVYVGSGNLTAVSKKSGEVLWSHNGGGASTTANSSIYVNTGNRLYAVSPVSKALGNERVVDMSESYASFPHINIGEEGLENSTVVIRLGGHSEGGITVEKVVLWMKDIVVRDSFELSATGPSGENFTKFIRRTGTVPVGKASFDQVERPEDWLNGMNVSVSINTSDLRVLGKESFDTVNVYKAEDGFSRVHRQEMNDGVTNISIDITTMSDLYIGADSKSEAGSVLYLNKAVFVGPSGTRTGIDGLVTTDTNRRAIGEIEVTNIGTRTADRSIKVKVGNKTVTTTDIRLQSGSSRKIGFESSINESGRYNISVDGHRIGAISVQESSDTAEGPLSGLIKLRKRVLAGILLVFLISVLGAVGMRRLHAVGD